MCVFGADAVQFTCEHMKFDSAIFLSYLAKTASSLAVWLCYKYVKNPKQLPNMASPFCIVTALVDRMDFTAHKLRVGTQIKR